MVCANINGAKQMLLQESVNAAIQLTVALIIAGLFYLFAGKNRGNFFTFTGLILPTKRAMAWAFAIALFLVPLSVALFYFTPLRDAAAGGGTVAGTIKAEGFSAEIIAVIAVVALIKTSLSEEIFFRGIIAKRLIRWLGFVTGNTIHAVAFGAVHLLIFTVPEGPEFSWPMAAAFFGFPAFGAWLKAWVNERIGNGSIVPGWFVHGATNFIAYPILAFA